MTKEDYLVAGVTITVAAGLAAIGSLYRYYYGGVYTNISAYDEKYKPKIPLNKAKVIIAEIRKEFEEIYKKYITDRNKTRNEYPKLPELFLNRLYFPKLEKDYKKLIADIAVKHNVTQDDIDEASDAYFDIPEIAEQKYFIEVYFNKFAPYGNEESDSNILPADFTLQILQEQLDMIKICLQKSDEEICKKNKSLFGKDIPQQLKEKVNLIKQYYSIYQGFKKSYETKLFNKYAINRRILLIATSKHRKNSLFTAQFEEIKEERKKESIKYGFDV